MVFQFFVVKYKLDIFSQAVGDFSMDPHFEFIKKDHYFKHSIFHSSNCQIIVKVFPGFSKLFPGN